MSKLPVIKLTMKELQRNKYGSRYIYEAVDGNGKVLSSRVETGKACNGKTYIAGLVTKNRNHKWAYSILRLFTSIDRIVTTSKDEHCRPYAIAILEEHKEAFKAKSKPLYQKALD